jgi:hypothetical protein
METLYWITRLDAISGMLCLFIVISVVGGIASSIGYHVNREEAEVKRNKYDQSEYESAIRYVNLFKKYFRICCITFFISIITNTFLPTTKEAYIIYGVGSTIDYVKSNEKAKQLPDKVIDALDKYLSEYGN